VLDIVAPHHHQPATLPVHGEAFGDAEPGWTPAAIRPVTHVQAGAERLAQQPGQQEDEHQHENKRDGEGGHTGPLFTENRLQELHDAGVPRLRDTIPGPSR
jgi:hypothetical protein